MTDQADNRERIQRMEAALREALQPDSLQIDDESHLHKGHAGAQSGRGHFRLRITARAFEGMNALARHRAIYGALGAMMETDIHALSIHARTPEEAAAG
ncbi:BolA family protein [Algiphilus sp.]|uniref:BolA family protein n=1 Tax=Algiphilus sp. TaxID=1872431 RepID=UPI001CA6A901|nr:BolA family protein [Algiphilus sp.]MBY8965356.1 BolA family transcriptional regulator [Algiphilus acroporae]MCI5063349.1 BolA family transcriptional regulator [Algiphilus sp.]MCI5102648.1 BolA family transcriptional regulator [Algiphilus sp.]MCR9089970.1 BolA family transcriptional regulator [Pseudomonadota bacterium]